LGPVIRALVLSQSKKLNQRVLVVAKVKDKTWFPVVQFQKPPDLLISPVVRKVFTEITRKCHGTNIMVRSFPSIPSRTLLPPCPVRTLTVATPRQS
jgi:hypothetical protein